MVQRWLRRKTNQQITDHLQKLAFVNICADIKSEGEGMYVDLI